MVIRCPARPVDGERGFSLLETLLAVALFSLGVLGAATLVTERLRESRAAHSHFLAEMLAQDLSARIQANPYALRGDDFRSWQRQAASTLPGLQCEAGALGGSPPAYRLELRWPLGSGEPGRLVCWIGR